MPAPHTTPPALQAMGLQCCHSCAHLMPAEAVLCDKCAAYLGRHVVRSGERPTQRKAKKTDNGQPTTDN